MNTSPHPKSDPESAQPPGFSRSARSSATRASTRRMCWNGGVRREPEVVVRVEVRAAHRWPARRPAWWCPIPRRRGMWTRLATRALSASAGAPARRDALSVLGPQQRYRRPAALFFSMMSSRRPATLASVARAMDNASSAARRGAMARNIGLAASLTQSTLPGLGSRPAPFRSSPTDPAVGRRADPRTRDGRAHLPPSSLPGSGAADPRRSGGRRRPRAGRAACRSPRCGYDRRPWMTSWGKLARPLNPGQWPM